MTMHESTPPEHRSSGLALAGLLTSCASLVVCPLAGVVGVILSVVAWVKATKEPERFGGKGMAIAGVCVGVFATVIIPVVLIGIMLPAIGQARQVAEQLRSASNMRMIAQGLIIYEQMYDTLPPADSWPTALVREGLVTRDVFVSPGAIDTSVVSYHFVPYEKVTWYFDDVLLYEWPMHHEGGGNVCYSDNRVVFELEPRFSTIVQGITLPDGTPVQPHLNPLPAP